eukprot:25275-Eustigmatos_ZCMA.PRE.1
MHTRSGGTGRSTSCKGGPSANVRQHPSRLRRYGSVRGHYCVRYHGRAARVFNVRAYVDLCVHGVARDASGNSTFTSSSLLYYVRFLFCMYVHSTEMSPCSM